MPFSGVRSDGWYKFPHVWCFGCGVAAPKCIRRLFCLVCSVAEGEMFAINELSYIPPDHTAAGGFRLLSSISQLLFSQCPVAWPHMLFYTIPST